MNLSSTDTEREIQLNDLNQDIIDCRLCPRLVAWREEVARVKRRAFKDEVYWGRPVPGFGDPLARVMIIGLAPGAHGSNRTGRMFTGDDSGVFLYRALHKAGFANQASGLSINDGLKLRDIYIAALCRCVPPDNKPTPIEVANCRQYLLRELEILKPEGIVALGRLAYEEVLRHFIQPQPGAVLPVFSHGGLISKEDLSSMGDRILPSQPAEYANQTAYGRDVRPYLGNGAKTVGLKRFRLFSARKSTPGLNPVSWGSGFSGFHSSFRMKTLQRSGLV